MQDEQNDPKNDHTDQQEQRTDRHSEAQKRQKGLHWNCRSPGTHEQNIRNSKEVRRSVKIE